MGSLRGGEGLIRRRWAGRAGVEWEGGGVKCLQQTGGGRGGGGEGQGTNNRGDAEAVLQQALGLHNQRQYSQTTGKLELSQLESTCHSNRRSRNIRTTALRF